MQQALMAKEALKKMSVNQPVSFEEFDILRKAVTRRVPHWGVGEVEDAIQTVLVKVVDQHILSRTYDPLAYFKKAVRNECVDQLEKSNRMKLLEEWQERAMEQEEDTGYLQDQIDSLKATLKLLSDSELKLLLLVFWFKAPREKVAGLYRISRNALRQRVHRLLMKVKKLILINARPGSLAMM